MLNKRYHIATYSDTNYKLYPYIECAEKTVIRLGGVGTYEDYPIQINSRQSVMDSIDKMKMKEIFKENEVKQSEFFYKNDKNIPFPCVFKPTKRSGGEGTCIVNNQEELDSILSEGYCEPFFTTTSEYRTYCSKYGMFLMIRKKKIENHEDDLFINRDNHSYQQKFVKPRLLKQIEEHSMKALNALGLDIACFDIGYSSKDKHDFVIFESNVSPEMKLNCIVEGYAVEINKLIKEKENK